MNQRNEPVIGNERSSWISTLCAVCLALYVGLVPLNCLTFAGLGSIYKFLALGIVGILMILVVYMQRIKLDSAILVWGAYVAYLGVSLLWSQDMMTSWTYFFGMLQIFAVSWLLIQWEYTEKQYTWIKGMIVFSGVVFFLLQLLLADEQSYSGRQLLQFGEMGGIDHNEFCAYFLAPIAICMQTFFRKQAKRSLRIGSIVLVVLFLYSILSTGSRGGLLAAVGVLLFMIVKGSKMSVKKVIYIVLSAVVAYALLYFLILPSLPEILADRFTFESIREDGGSGRTEIWRDTVLMLLENPGRLMFGCGIFGAVDVPQCSHNMLLQVTLDSGLLGLGIYLLLLVRLIRSLKGKELYVQAAFWGIQISMLTLSAYAWFKAVWIIYMLCMLRVKKQPEKREEAGLSEQASC